MKTKNPKPYALAVMVLLVLGGCQGSDLTRSAVPIELLLTTTAQNFRQIDLKGGANCTNPNVGSFSIETRPKNTHATGQLLDVRLTSYQVTYTRTDGGKQVPASYVRAMDLLVASGSKTSFPFRLLDFSFNQAPFPALFPQNGGVDPDTGQRSVKMNITVAVFGETLGGDKVIASTTLPMDFCYDCGGCIP